MASCPHHSDQEPLAECVKFQRKFCPECFRDPKTRESAECLSPDSHCQFRSSCLVWELSREHRRRRKSG